MDVGNLSVKNDMEGKNDMTRKWKDMKGKDMKATAKAWMGRLAQELKEKERWKAITFWREENELHEVTEQCFCFIDMLWYIQHRWSFCCLHIYSFNALPQALLYSSIKRGGFELPCAILFGLAHIETRGLRRVYETALRSWFGESSNFNHMKGRFMSMKQKTNGLEQMFITTIPLWISFLGSTRVPFAHLTWGLIDLKLAPIQGIVSKKEVHIVFGFGESSNWKWFDRK